MKKTLLLTLPLLMVALCSFGQKLKLNDLEYFEARGLNVLVYSNEYAGIFCDEKTAGIELIQRGVRVSTGGCIRLCNTPEQWDIFPIMTDRKVDSKTNTIEVELTYEDYNFTSKLSVTPKGNGFTISVNLDKAVPANLEGKAGLNLEFFPATYYGKTYMMDGMPEIFPRAAAGSTFMLPRSQKVEQFYNLSTFDDRGRDEFIVAKPMSTGHSLVIAPEDPDLRLLIKSDSEINLFDGRNLAQNCTFVVRTILPAGKTGKVLEWYLEPSIDESWVRKANVGISQIGYTPAQKKVSVVELDKNAAPVKTATVYRVTEEGKSVEVLKPEVKTWGVFNNRYNYATIDFSAVKQPGLYYIQYGDVKTNTFPINKNVYDGKWHTTMDVWLPVQMDHMEVNEGYRTWHGRSYMDDALQAPTNYQQFDGYTMRDKTNTKYQPWERIPNLAVGAWYDAGDFDIQSGTVTGLVSEFSNMWEIFRPERDETYIDQKTQFVDIHRPDGVADVLQQIEHGVLNVIAQVENIGFVAQGIIPSNLYQYHHLGDAMTITDNLLYNPKLKPYESDGLTSGTCDDRVAFTGNYSPAGNMSTIACLAAAARTLKEYNPVVAERALKNALRMWNENYEAADPANNRNQGQSTRRFAGGGDPRMSAAMQLWLTTKDDGYKKYFVDAITNSLTPRTNNAEGMMMGRGGLNTALYLYPYMDKSFQDKVKAAVPAYVESAKKVAEQTPYGVPVSGRGWGGNEQVISWAYSNYMVWRYFPDMIDADMVLRGLNYLYGCHPYSNVSFVNSVGVNTKKVAYGNNRADYTVIPGGIVPGVMMMNPDFMEHKDDYPFLWGENECCTRTVPNYVMLSIACEQVAAAINK